MVGPQPVGLAAEVCGRRRGFGYVSVGIPDRAQQYTGPDWTSEMSQTREARRRALAHEQARVGMAGAGDNIQPRRNPGLAMKKYRDESSPDRTGRCVDLWTNPRHGMDSVCRQRRPINGLDPPRVSSCALRNLNSGIADAI